MNPAMAAFSLFGFRFKVHDHNSQSRDGPRNCQSDFQRQCGRVRHPRGRRLPRSGRAMRWCPEAAHTIKMAAEESSTPPEMLGARYGFSPRPIRSML